MGLCSQSTPLAGSARLVPLWFDFLFMVMFCLIKVKVKQTVGSGRFFPAKIIRT
jgi:hypothetical protein